MDTFVVKYLKITHVRIYRSMTMNDTTNNKYIITVGLSGAHLPSQTHVHDTFDAAVEHVKEIRERDLEHAATAPEEETFQVDEITIDRDSNFCAYLVNRGDTRVNREVKVREVDAEEVEER